jgi:hypothetical protein
MLARRRIALRTLRYDPIIQELVDQVSTDSLTASIQRLQDFETRFMLEDSSYAASAWLKNTLTRWGYPAVFDSFYVSETHFGDWPGQGWERNVIAQRPGTAISSETYLIGGHFDSVVYWPDTSYCHTQAPGADDNAAGAAATLEAARVFREHAWEPNLYFVCWGNEEIDGLGSEHFADSVATAGMPIDAVLNLDLIGYDVTGARAVWLDCLPCSRWLSDIFTLAAAAYTPELVCKDPEIDFLGSDHYSFRDRGYDAMMVSEEWGNLNPYYHTILDTLANLEPELYTLSTKAMVATLAVLCIYPAPTHDVVAHDAGNGFEAAIAWTPTTQADVVAYQVRWGTTSGVPTDSLLIPDPAAAGCTLGGLEVDVPCYVTVWTLDNQGRESYVADEVSVTPRLVPTVPTSVVATPVASGIRIDWAPNGELDLAGYRVYWRTENATTYDSLSTGLLADTTVTHSGLSWGLYYYAVRAFDAEGNASALSTEVCARPITLDQGILVVDETNDAASFPDSVRDAFYAGVLAAYTFAQWDFDSEATRPILEDLSPYSTVLWHAEDYTEFLAPPALPDLAAYLEAGGNLLVVGWKPVADFGGSTTYPSVLNSDSFARRFLGVATVDLTPVSDLVDAALGVGEVPSVHVNPETSPLPSWQGKLKYIESLTPTDEAVVTHTISVADPASPYHGTPCGIRSSPGTYQTALLTLPLSYTLPDDAATLLRFMLDEFGELGGARDPGVLPAEQLRLLAAEPNPFGSQTTITYELATAGMARVAIYDLSGRQVRVVSRGVLPAGVGSVAWDGRRDDGSLAAGGIYLCVLRQGDASATCSLALLR